MSDENKWSQQDAPPPPLFFNQKERDLVKQVNDELIERVIGQTIMYYPIDLELTEFHPLYGESLQKNFLAPVRIHAMVKWEGHATTATNYGVDRLQTINVAFHKRRLTEDQDLFVREGDFILHGKLFYEIVTLQEPKWLFGQVEKSFEIGAKCIRSREGTFNAQ
jgi:hypothetical protein